MITLGKRLVILPKEADRCGPDRCGPDPRDLAKEDLKDELPWAAPVASQHSGSPAIAPKMLGLSDPNQPVSQMPSFVKENGNLPAGRGHPSECSRGGQPRVQPATLVANPNSARNDRPGGPRANLRDEPD